MELEQWISTEIGRDIWKNKYRDENETFEEWKKRVAGNNKIIEKLIEEQKFLPGGRILANRGLGHIKKLTYGNCYVVKAPEDNIESIFDCARDLARTFSYGGGCGVDISKLAPSGAKVNNAAKTTSGSVSFCDLYSLVSELIAQNGRRKIA